MIYRNNLYHQFTIIAMTLLGLVMTTACSNNVEDGLYADSNSNIALSVSASGFQNGVLTIGSAQSATPFTVTSTTRWTVDITDCEGAWCQVTYGDNSTDQSAPIGNGSFMIDAAPNRSGSARECNVTVYAVSSDGQHIPGQSILIHLIQDRQSILIDYAGDVISPYGTTQATEPTVTVTANQSWTVSSSHDWIKIIPGSEMDGDSFAPADGSAEEKAVSFRISVGANPGTSTRSGELTISSPSSSFTPIRLNVTQEGSTATFLVTPTNVPIVSYQGSVIEFQVYSPRDSWTVHAISNGDWISFDRTSGNASTENIIVKATIASNFASESRDGTIIFTREGGMGETNINITQQSNLQIPTVSEPWLVSGWTQTQAQLKAYYLSPVIEVMGCGAYIHPVSDDSDVKTYQGQFGENNQIIINMDGLQTNTMYKTWVFVLYPQNGQTQVASGNSIIFSTPDANGVPNAGGNTPPIIN